MTEIDAFELAMKHPDLLGQYGAMLPEKAVDQDEPLLLWIKDPEEGEVVRAVPIEVIGPLGRIEGWETLTVRYYGSSGVETAVLPFDTYGCLVDARQPIPPQIGFIGGPKGTESSRAYEPLCGISDGTPPDLEHLGVAAPE